MKTDYQASTPTYRVSLSFSILECGALAKSPGCARECSMKGHSCPRTGELIPPLCWVWRARNQAKENAFVPQDFTVCFGTG